MNPAKVIRDKVRLLTDLPNVGKATAADLVSLGIESPEQLRSRDPFELYFQLCDLTQTQQDPCVLDVFMSLTDFINGAEPKPWWKYTAQRKKTVARYELRVIRVGNSKLEAQK